MLYLLSHIDFMIWAFPCDHIVEIIPRVKLKNVSHSVEALSGLLSYRGDLIPIIDFPYLLLGRDAEKALTTRIIIFELESTMVGVLTERVTETYNREAGATKTPSMQMQELSFLERVFDYGEEVVQVVDITKLAKIASSETRMASR